MLTHPLWTDLLEMTRSDLVLIADATDPRAGHVPDSIVGPHGEVRVATIDSDVKPHGSKEVIRLNNTSSLSVLKLINIQFGSG